MNATTGAGCRPRRNSRPLAGLLAVVVPGAAVLAAACGGSGGSGSGGPARTLYPATYRQYHAYSRCMRSHGAPFWPEPTEVSHGVFDSPYRYQVTAKVLAREHGPGWQAAVAACHSLAPQGIPFTAAQISALRSQLEKLAACMRAHGIAAFPSPVAGASGGGFPSPGKGVSPDSARFEAAQRACWRYAPGSR